MTHPVHNAIYSHVQNILKAQPELSHDAKLVTMPQRQWCMIMFKNYTDNFPSLRLSFEGFSLLSKVYQSWGFPLGDQGDLVFQQGKMLLGLHRHMKMPYFWNRTDFYVFGNEYALEIEMVQRDLKHWMHSFL